MLEQLDQVQENEYQELQQHFAIANQEQQILDKRFVSKDSFSHLNDSQSTNYQTYFSSIYIQSDSHKRITDKGLLNLHSSSPVRKRHPSNFIPKMLMTSRLQDQRLFSRKSQELKGYKSQRIQYKHQQNKFRTRIVKNIDIGFNIIPTKPPFPHISASNYCAYFTDSSHPVLSSKIHEKRQIASLTKVMTAYAVLRICHQFGIKIREHYIPIHSRASYMQGTTANLKNGEEILLIDLFYGLLLPSGNDASIALAQYFGKYLSFKFVKDNSLNQQSANMQKFNQCKKFYDLEYERESIKLFVFEMNKYAHNLGMSNTKFVNPTGLTNVENYSTAADMALLVKQCLKNAFLRMVFKKKLHKCDVRNQKLGYNQQVTWKSTNKLLYKVRQCIGVKTGITPGAGPCLSSAFRIGNRQLVVIVMNSSDSEQRFNDSQKIFKWCRKLVNFQHF